MTDRIAQPTPDPAPSFDLGAARLPAAGSPASMSPVRRSRKAPVAAPAARMTSSARPRRRGLTADDYQALGAFRLALRRFLAFSEAEARALGLSPQQHQALLVVRTESGPRALSVGQLAERLLIRNHSAVGLVERLAERGLLTRTPATDDRRRIELSLTSAGAAALEVISRKNLAKLKSTVPVFLELMRTLERLEAPAPARGSPPPCDGVIRPED